MDSEPELTDVENGQLADLGVRLRVIDVESVRRWADSLIEREAEPAPWMIDLALVTGETAWDLLHRFALVEPSRRVLKIVSAIIARNWIRGGLTDRQLAKLGYELFCDVPHFEETVWGYRLEQTLETRDQGWIKQSDAEFHDYCRQQLAPCLGSDVRIPAWIEPPTAG
jgi:hypothetical protein